MTRKPIDSKLVQDAVDSVLESNPNLVDEYYLDTHGAVNDLVGKVVEETNGRIDSTTALSAVKARLDGER